MKAEDYLAKHVRTTNNHIRVVEIKEDGPFCVQCWEKNRELNDAPFDQGRNGWLCKKCGHLGSNTGLASGTVVRTNLP